MEIKARDKAEKILISILEKLKSIMSWEKEGIEKSDLYAWDAKSEICSTSQSNDREESSCCLDNSSPSSVDENLAFESPSDRINDDGEITEEIKR